MDVQAGSGYPTGQLAKAFVTAVTHEDPGARDRAEERLRGGGGALGHGLGAAHVGLPHAGGRLARLGDAGGRARRVRHRQGGRGWAAPRVRGGAGRGGRGGGGARPALRVAPRRGRPRRAGGLLDSGGYRGSSSPSRRRSSRWRGCCGPGIGPRPSTLLDAVGPFAGELAFAPVPDPAAGRDWSVVWREPAGEAAAALRQRGENERVEAMREALAVWNPLADELLELWLETRDGSGAVAAVFPPGWRERAGELLARYERLAAEHTRCGKHRRPRENLAVMLAAAREAVMSAAPAPRTRGLLRSVVAAMLARRGRPGSPGHAALRAVQARVAAVPGHHRLARVVVARIAALDPDAGIPDVDAACAPVTAGEAAAHGLPAGVAVPEPIRRVVRRARRRHRRRADRRGRGPVGRGTRPSWCRRSPPRPAPPRTPTRLCAPDGRHYRAFRRRRSLLLVDLQHQVRLENCPGFQALGPTGRPPRTPAGRPSRRCAGSASWRSTGSRPRCCRTRWCASCPRSRREAGEDLPCVEELAADIFMGRFSPKFVRAAQLAGRLLAGRLYARYYDIDYAALPADVDEPAVHSHRRAQAARRPRAAARSVAANGMVIEQAQILTTHNLATLAGPLGVTPPDGWPALARRRSTGSCGSPPA